MAKELIWFIVFLSSYCCSGQQLDYPPDVNLKSAQKFLRICFSMYCNSLQALKELENCDVILGHLRVVLIERAKRENFKGLSFPNLTEITDYMVVYRVRGLESLGDLFPNLARIRGEQLFDNYALVVHDMPNLREVGLYSLLKVDRGGVIVWASPTICFADTIDWKTIAPNTRHVLGPPGKGLACTTTCTCSNNASTNYCWNNKKCQRFVSGPDGEQCHEECFGCRKTDPTRCSLCRHYTYQNICVRKCPKGTILLEINKYCLTKEYCKGLGRWEWNNTCVSKCPIGYKEVNISGTITCESCDKCYKTCNGRQIITKLEVLQEMERCVYINGSLTIHIRLLPEAMEELRKYLYRIEEVADYIFIYDSMMINSLDFLPNLKRIRGRALKNDAYSFIIKDMPNLQSLFLPNVTRNLEVGNGTIVAYNNPMVCSEELEILVDRFPVRPNDTNIPLGKNGYKGKCAAIEVHLRVHLVNEFSAIVTFRPVPGTNSTYSVLYVKLSPRTEVIFVPESCSDSEWYVVPAPKDNVGEVKVKLQSLHPASTYGLCIEKYDYDESGKQRVIIRSAIVNFTTPVGKPARPFITELVAPSSDAVVIRWVNHKDYKVHVTHYQLDVIIIDVHERDAEAKDHCKDTENWQTHEYGYSLHTVASRPPAEYDTGCESMCGLLSTATQGAMLEERFDFCSASGLDCDSSEADPPVNETFRGYVKSVYFDFISNGSTNEYEVAGLAPYRDYRFRLRACVDRVCSTSARRVVRTLAMKDADRVATFNAIHYGEDGLYVEWEPPVLPNGLVLAYLVEVKTKQIHSGLRGGILPQVWCVGSSDRTISVKPENSEFYSVRVCTKTLACISTCVDWIKVVASPTHRNWWWGGAILGLLICILSLLITSCKKMRVEDNIPLVENIDFEEETEPIFLSGIIPCIYNIPLNDSH